MTHTDRLREEHRELMAGVESLRLAGDVVGTVPRDVALATAEHAIAFLLERLIPHAEREEDVLYPAVAKALGGPRSTATMVRDHAEVKRLTGQLTRAVEEDDESMMRRLLYGLYHVILLHFAKEEEVYLPVLEESLDEAEAKELFHLMHVA